MFVDFDGHLKERYFDSLIKSLKDQCKMSRSLKASAIVIGTRLANSVLHVHRTWSLRTCTRLTSLHYNVIIDANGSLSGGPSLAFVTAVDRVVLAD